MSLATSPPAVPLNRRAHRGLRGLRRRIASSSFVALAVTVCPGCGGCDDPVATAPRQRPAEPGSRGAAPLDVADVPGPRPVSDQSAGIFIGVEAFVRDPTLSEVRYAVKDAIDLAELFIDLGLLRPETVTLLLGGGLDGVEPESEVRLERLEARGVTVLPAESEIVLRAVLGSARRVGTQGMLVLSISTHGFFDGSDHHLLTADSTSAGDWLSARELADATLPAAGLRFLIVDACRTRLVQSNEPASTQRPDARTALTARLADTLAAGEGYIVLLAASVGGHAWPDGSGNGILTAAILDTLRCNPPSGSARVVQTLELANLVRRRVTGMSNGRQYPEYRIGGSFEDVVLAECRPVGEIVEPVDGEEVALRGVVLARLFASNLHLRAVLLSEVTGVHYVQNVTAEAAPGREGATVRIPVQYGNYGHYQIFVALSEDPDFLVGRPYSVDRPDRDGWGRPVLWLGPVHVVAVPHRKE